MIEGSRGRARWWFTDRHGGVSSGPYASLNLGTHVGDDARAVRENRVQLASDLGLVDQDQWCWLNQVHGATVIDADAGWDGVPDADAAVTTRIEQPLVVMTADCAPLLLVAGDGEAVATVHAGWGGLAKGVIGAAVTALRERTDAPIHAVLGPCIQPEHYEFGADDLAALAAQLGPAVVGVTGMGTPALNLPAGVRHACAEAGVTSFEDLEIDTFASPDHFSYRRDGETGRQALVAVLT